MKNTITIEARCFPVIIQGTTESIKHKDSIVLSKEQLQAAQLVGQSSKELINRLYNRNGFEVLDIGKPEKKTLVVDLNDLWEW